MVLAQSWLKQLRREEHPIALASRLLRLNESRWTTTELEAHAMVWALDKSVLMSKALQSRDSAVTTRPTPLVDMPREQHDPRAGGGEVAIAAQHETQM
ncbi:hypothetical protein Efla_001093 [Eimeria flavescens]